MTSRRRLGILALLVVVALGGLAAWRFVLAPPDLPPGVIVVSGRIEGDDAAVAAKTSGRIRQITVREGDHVEAGQVLAQLDDEQIRARERQAAAAVRQAEARVALSGHQIAVLNEQLLQSQLGMDQSKVDAQGRVSEAEGKLAAAEAQLAQAEAAYAMARWDREAMVRLFQKELVAEQDAQRAQRNEESQAAVVAAARRQVEASRGSLMAAKSNLMNPAIRASQGVAVQGQILQARADIAAAEADAERARHARRGARQPPGPSGGRAVRGHGGHAHGGARRGGDGGHAHRHAGESGRGVPSGFRAGRADRPGPTGPAGARLPRLGSAQARRRAGDARRSAGLVHAREHLLP
jgi:HlyD family secretion protein